MIGADGIASMVAREVGAAVLKQGQWATAVQYAYYRDAAESGYEWAYANGAAAGFIPTNDGLSCVFVGTTPERMRALRSVRRRATRSTRSSRSRPRGSWTGSRAPPATRQHGWAGVQGFVRRRPVPAGRWSGTRRTSRTRSARTASPTPCATRSCSPSAVVEALSGARAESVALAGYEATRDRLSTHLFQVSDEIAAYDWDISEVPGLMRRVSAAMTDEVEYLESLRPGSRLRWARRSSTDDVVVRR